MFGSAQHSHLTWFVLMMVVFSSHGRGNSTLCSSTAS